nr:ATPase [Nitrospinaceae bacterium]NIR56070.1 ATPase [Nitrospinaceae bacterium]NIS86515.1 ATPase [Nitrospinaceae bacterium]NIT83353.1 ATPase [Nitrospinaceae bacterium]NIU45559.1 ATPase [Nitrospinaceae bacterium]
PRGSRPEDVRPVLNRNDILELQKQVESVRVDGVLVDYILSILTATRHCPHLSLGVSPRGGLIYQQAARARALVQGRDYCIPDDIKQLAVPVLCHRVIPQSHQGALQRRYADTAAIIRDLIDQVGIPV